jgi:hypothetical protein
MVKLLTNVDDFGSCALCLKHFDDIGRWEAIQCFTGTDMHGDDDIYVFKVCPTCRKGEALEYINQPNVYLQTADSTLMYKVDSVHGLNY